MIDSDGEIVQVHHYYEYCPPGVERVLASGASARIGEVDDSTVFKYPKDPDKEAERFAAERKILEALPPHKHRATNGTVAEYMLEGRPLSLQQRLTWCPRRGGSMEPCRFSLPRDDFQADLRTDLFALGCTIYYILLGYTIFPDVNERGMDASEIVEERLRKKEWPRERHACGAVSFKCWQQQYDSAEEAVRDLEAIERDHAQPSTAASIESSGLEDAPNV
ncbi:kinase-like protein [Staphylotrichum tortipilum]|uniref:Kinase-like protein n=1 Tax=Staphylotrichum tortipilum TaxID=2831512 RepID=A0AAN6RQL9_9PEZI|nr:kinase-like protein [Staphylotrichum longicolle]